MTIQEAFLEAVFSNESLSTKARKELPDSAFGVPDLRKFPLYDAKGKADPKHVRSAMAYFGKCPEKYKKTLAKAILKAAKECDIEINKDAKWYKYI